jgi:hypothetical protein
MAQARYDGAVGAPGVQRSEHQVYLIPHQTDRHLEENFVFVLLVLRLKPNSNHLSSTKTRPLVSLIGLGAYQLVSSLSAQSPSLNAIGATDLSGQNRTNPDTTSGKKQGFQNGSEYKCGSCVRVANSLRRHRQTRHTTRRLHLTLGSRLNRQTALRSMAE